MLQIRTFTCVECDKSFTKMIGGVIMPPKDQELILHPVCNKCKLRRIADILGINK